MAETFDVPGRLAQGRPAVEALSQYVWAAHQVGYADPDLTLHPGQVRDWYGTEDGMDLVALQRDCLSLDAAVRAAREALAIQERQGGALSHAWQGSGAQAARQFLHRHGTASAAVADALAAAAAALHRALEQLWRAVDTKVETTLGVEAEVGAARGQWQAAAETMISGAGDRAAAAELVDTAVKPFVHDRIGAEWLTAMQAASAAVTEAYRGATAEIHGGPPVVFDIPGELGPSAPPPPLPPPPPPVASVPAPAGVTAEVPAPTAPAAWVAPAAVAPPAFAPPPAPLAPTPPVPEATPPAGPPPPLAPAAAPMSDLGASAGMPAVGQRFADALSGLLGGDAADDAIDLPAGLAAPEPEFDTDDDTDTDDEVDDTEEKADADDPEEDPEPGEPEELSDEEPAGDQLPPEEESETVAAPAPTPPPPPPPADPLPEPPPPVEERTPCEIAADEVPQVGGLPASEPGAG
ncbi:MAG: hypothetical protein AB1925_28130 [Actinomycetota bacterium]